MGISTHILDTAKGKPAAGVGVVLKRSENSVWFPVSSAKTDADGRCAQLLPHEGPLRAGIYRIQFDTAAYYAAEKIQGLYPVVEIVFEVREGEQHYHVPLLLTANGYTTYRGS